MLTNDEMAMHTNGKKRRYWFVVYTTILGYRIERCNMVTDEHPLEWLADYLSKPAQERPGKVLLDFYKETSREHYERLRSLIG